MANLQKRPISPQQTTPRKTNASMLDYELGKVPYLIALFKPEN